MKANLPVILSTVCLTTLLSHTALADQHETEQHGAHEHGAARMTVALIETGLEIMLASPAANYFGFEHPAVSDEEHRIVHEAASTLKAAEKLLSFDRKAACELKDVEIDSAIIAAHHQAKHDDEDHPHEQQQHDHDEQKQEQKPEHHDHDDDSHGHDHDHDKEGGHSDVHVTWHFSCAHPNQLQQMDTGIFAAFQGFERLNIEWITLQAAGAVKLTTDDTVIFRQ